ncbi:hypothetical protein ABBQ32_008801 [Trebouxia sp. C0010 RCD-2024]
MVQVGAAGLAGLVGVGLAGVRAQQYCLQGQKLDIALVSIAPHGHSEVLTICFERDFDTGSSLCARIGAMSNAEKILPADEIAGCNLGTAVGTVERMHADWQILQLWFGEARFWSPIDNVNLPLPVQAGKLWVLNPTARSSVQHNFP